MLKVADLLAQGGLVGVGVRLPSGVWWLIQYHYETLDGNIAGPYGQTNRECATEVKPPEDKTIYIDKNTNCFKFQFLYFLNSCVLNIQGKYILKTILKYYLNSCVCSVDGVRSRAI